jgi:predicted nucleic acid-binding protein
MDDREGRSFATNRHLPVTGTLGVLERADVVGILSDLPSTLARLEASSFYLSVRLRDSVLTRYRSRHGIGF